MRLRPSASEAPARYTHFDLALTQPRAARPPRAQRAGRSSQRTLGIARQHLGSADATAQETSRTEPGFLGLATAISSGVRSGALHPRNRARSGTSRYAR